MRPNSEEPESPTYLFHVDHTAAADSSRRCHFQILNLEHHVQRGWKLDALGVGQAERLVVIQYLRELHTGHEAGDGFGHGAQRHD